MNLYSRELLRQFLGSPSRTAIEAAGNTAQILAENFLNDRKGRILQLALAENINQNMLQSMLADIDIESLPGSDALLLALAKQKHSNADFGADIEPRLKGLIQYHRFANLRQQSIFSETVARINRAGVIPMAGSDITMKYYSPAGLRFFDFLELIAVSDADYDAIRREFSDEEFILTENEYSFEICSENPAGGLKLRVFKASVMRPDIPELSADTIAKRSEIKDVYHTRCYVPSPEDTVILTFLRIWNKVRKDDNFHSVTFDIRDLFFLIREHGISEDIIKERINKSGAFICEYYFIAQFLNRISAGLLPCDFPLQEEFSPRLEEFLRYEKNRIDYVYNQKSIKRTFRRIINKVFEK